METQKNSWLKLISKEDFEKVKGKYEFKDMQAEKTVGQAGVNDALALRVTTGSGLKILGAKVLNKDTPELFAKLMSEGVSAI